MEQKDYLLREIEKIGLLLRMILSKIIPSGENSSITFENQIEDAKELLLDEAGFDLDKFLSLNASEIEEYISSFNGIRGSNIELLADILKEIGMKTKTETSKRYLEKALNLYELCSSLDKTFSFEREGKINEIKNNM